MEPEQSILSLYNQLVATIWYPIQFLILCPAALSTIILKRPSTLHDQRQYRTRFGAVFCLAFACVPAEIFLTIAIWREIGGHSSAFWDDLSFWMLLWSMSLEVRNDLSKRRQTRIRTLKLAVVCDFRNAI